MRRCINGNSGSNLLSACLSCFTHVCNKEEMGNKLYVGNLSFRVTSEDLQEFFAAAGAVDSANVVYDRETGRSRGFGFVEMGSDDEAAAAVAQFNGQEYDGRAMVVNEARPREDRPRGGGSRSSYGGGGGGYAGNSGGYGGGDRW